MHMFTLELLLLLCMHMLHLVAKSHKYIHHKWWIQGHADIKFYSAFVIPLIDDVTGFPMYVCELLPNEIMKLYVY